MISTFNSQNLPFTIWQLLKLADFIHTSQKQHPSQKNPPHLIECTHIHTQELHVYSYLYLCNYLSTKLIVFSIHKYTQVHVCLHIYLHTDKQKRYSCLVKNHSILLSLLHIWIVTAQQLQILIIQRTKKST